MHLKFAMAEQSTEAGQKHFSEKCHKAELIYDDIKPEAERSLWRSGTTSTAKICLLCHEAKKTEKDEDDYGDRM